MWPMKKTPYEWAILPWDSARSSCVSKYARSTYGRQLNFGRMASRISRLTFLVVMNPVFFAEFLPTAS